MPNNYKAVQRQTAQYDLFNRVHSISSDSAFVRATAEAYDHRFEVIPNQRCGTWYCDPSSSSAVYAYFKSTDGHTGNWGFNMRRSNLPFAEMAEMKGGLILVDSTRRGKRMPDALSKTVPIWCAVINHAIARRRRRGKEEEWDGELYTPPNVVSGSERAQIEEKLDGWAEALETSTLPLPDLLRPLRPFWIHPNTTQPPRIPPDPPYTPIICVSASRWVGSEDDVPLVTKLAGRTVGFSYVQGAGDDDELWSKGLTPALFYRNKERLLAVDRDDLGELVEDIVGGLEGLTSNLGGLKVDDVSAVGVPGPSSKLALAIGAPSSSSTWTYPAPIHTLRIITIDKSRKGEPSTYRTSPTSSIFACHSARSHPGAYTHALDDLVEHVEDLLDEECSIILRPGTSEQLDQALKLEEGETVELEDISLSPEDAIEGRRTILPLALVLLLSIPDLAGHLAERNGLVDKGVIADMLHQLVALWPDGNPPRAALRRVNEYLMSKRECVGAA